METAEQLRYLIAQYRARLKEGESGIMVVHIIEAIKEAERKLAELEGASAAAKD